MVGKRLRFTMGQVRYQPLGIILALAVAWLGLWMHELYRVPSMLGLTPDGSLPLLAIAIALPAWWLLAAHKRAASLALLVYGLINGVGGFLSVLPLPFLPFVPEQTAEHYLVHMIYALCQIPLIIVALSRSKMPMK
jgi:hypothetical protein